jgi:hypothetical protein
MKLTTYPHLVPRLRTHEAIPPLPQYVFTAWYLIKGYVFIDRYFVKDRENLTFILTYINIIDTRLAAKYGRLGVCTVTGPSPIALDAPPRESERRELSS